MNIRQKYMSRAIEIAGNGNGTTAPNPAVGAVLVHNGTVIGEGYTSSFGGPHAEVNAIALVVNRGSTNGGSSGRVVPNEKMLREATLYVTLEPCSHYGKTPPCTDLIIEKKIKTVVIGLRDPHEKVAGSGIAKLKKAGVEVITGILEEKCREHHKRFLTFHEKRRPYIILKWAQTADGFIAPPAHERGENLAPVWISHPYSRQLVHQWRSEEQAILVGTNTVLEDNPKLDVRHWTGKNPPRIVLDRNLKTHVSDKASKEGLHTMQRAEYVESTSKIEDDYHVLDGSVPTLVLTEVEDASRYRTDIGYRILKFSENTANNIVKILHKQNFQSVLIEGGAQTLQTFIDSDLWDEARLFEGISSFEKGIKAPVLSGKLIASKTIGTDRLKIYRRP